MRPMIDLRNSVLTPRVPTRRQRSSHGKWGKKRAKLDHGISWKFSLATPRAVFNDTAHQRFDHAVLSFGLPAEEFPRKPQPARRPLAPTDRTVADAVFFQKHIRAWQEAVQCRMHLYSGEIDGDALMAMQRADQEVMKDEVLNSSYERPKPDDEPTIANPDAARNRQPSDISISSSQPPTLKRWTTKMEKELLVPPIGHSNTWVSTPCLMGREGL